jgi:hypothetical protein
MKSLKRLLGLHFRQLHRDPAGTRTQGPIIKSDVLYQLSYEIITALIKQQPFSFWECKNSQMHLSLQNYLNLVKA